MIGVARSWTCHWQFRYWRPNVNSEGQPVRTSGSNSFRKRGVSVGDSVYVVSLGGGQLYLGGRMTVGRIVTRPEAARLWDNDNLYDADEWAVDPEQSGTLLDLHRRLDPALTKRLRFETKSGPKGLCFISDAELDNQATRGVRELTPESAALLDRIIAVTDRLPKSGQTVTITGEVIGDETPATPGGKQKSSSVPTYLLTWNPDHWDGEIKPMMNWSCGHTKRIQPGDRLFLISQGREPRGVCASAGADSGVTEDVDGRFVAMRLEAYRNPEAEPILSRLALDELNQGAEPPMKWGIQSSGTQIPEQVAQRLEQAWRELLGGSPTDPEEPPATATATGPAGRVVAEVSRIIRDTQLADRIKELHQFECQLCGHTIVLPDGSRYAEGHHIQPLGAPHDGPDTGDNVLCLCPNHHAACDLGAIPLAICDVRRAAGHVVGLCFIDYHNRVVYRGSGTA